MASGKIQLCGCAIYNKWLNLVLMTPKLLLGPQTPACPDLDMSQAHYHITKHWWAISTNTRGWQWNW